MTEKTVKSPILERRTPVDASAPLVQSEWRVEDGKVVGDVVWASCVSHRTWTVDEQRVKRVRPIREAAWLTFGAGAAFSILGLATRDTEWTAKCSQDFQATGFETCNAQPPDNTFSDLNIVAGALGLVTGSILLALEPSDTITVLKHEPHSETTVASCVATEDLSDMSLLLKLGPNRFVHVSLQSDGQASADLGPGARLPKGADLPILVYRAPPTLTKILPRWQTIGHVHVPD